VTTFPRAVTTLSIGINHIASRPEAKRRPIARMGRCTVRGTGAAIMAPVGD